MHPTISTRISRRNRGQLCAPSLGDNAHWLQPHQTMGMIGFILVGDFTSNLEAVREAAASLRGRDTTRRVEAYLAEIDAIAAEEGLA